MTIQRPPIKSLLFIVATVMFVVLVSRSTTHAQTIHQTSSAGTGMTALQAAAQKGSYLYIFFWKRSDQQTQSMRQVFFQGVRQIGDSVDTVEVNINDSREKAIVDRFDVSRAPMPLVLALAPNGAVTKGFPHSLYGGTVTARDRKFGDGPVA